jgi:hypothetical protein
MLTHLRETVGDLGYGGCDEKAWAGNGLVSEDHAAGQAARAGDAAALAPIPGRGSHKVPMIEFRE